MNVLRRIPWYLLGGVVLGIALGLVYSWLISPVKYVDGAPDALRADFKDQYRVLIAAAYQVDGNLDRAQARLAALGEPDPAPALTEQASRLLAAGDPEGSAYALLMLAQAFQPATPTGVASSTPLVVITPATMPPPLTPSLTETPGGTLQPSATAMLSPTPRPTRTLTPTPGLPYVLASQETVCDPNLLGVLIQVEVLDAAGNPIPGVDLLIAWDGGQEHFFTGLKPELGDGYADYTMTPGIVYTVQVSSGGAAASGLEAPSCESGGATWWGSLLLVFQQP